MIGACSAGGKVSKSGAVTRVDPTADSRLFISTMAKHVAIEQQKNHNQNRDLSDRSRYLLV
jgi:hypothetical protein